MTARLFTTVYAANDLPTEEAHIASKSLGTVDAWTELEYEVHEHGTGRWVGRINRNHPQAALLVQDRYVLIHSDAGVVGGAFLEAAPIDLSAADGPGDEWMIWGGRGQVAILERGRMDNDSNLSGGKDPIDGYWDLDSQGDFAGASNAHPIPMLKRALVEMQLNVPSGIPEVDHSSFDYDLDTDGAAVPFLDGEAQGANVGDDGLTLLQRMDQLGGVVFPMSPLFKLDAFLVHGTDRSGAFGATTVRFEKEVNVAVAIARKVRGSVYISHLLVGGADFAYVTVVDPAWVAGDVVRWGFLAVPEASDPGQLAAAGLAHIDARKRQTDAWELPLHDHGDDPAAGIYEPAPDIADGHFWIGDFATMDTGSGPYDANEEVVPIASIKWTLKTGDDANGDYVVTVGVGSTFKWSAPGAEVGSQHNLQLCSPFIACGSLTAGDLTAGAAANGDAENPGGGQWSGHAYQTTRYRAGARSYGMLTGTVVDVTYAFAPAQVFLAGVRYVLDVWASQRGVDTADDIRFGVPGVDEITTFVGGASVTGDDGATWDRTRLCWTPTADRTGVRFRWSATQTLDGWYVFDDLALYTAVGADHGTDPCMTRGDHSHIHGTLSGRSVVESHPASAVSYDGTASGLSADDAQAAIDEVAALVSGAGDHGALTGLADDDHPQYATNAEFDDHSARHENGGADEVSVAGLSGLLADPQTPLAHDIDGALHNGFPGGTTDFLRADGAFAAPPGSGGGHVIQEDDTPLTQRTNLNFGAGLIASDDAGDDASDVDIDFTEVADVAHTHGSPAAGFRGVAVQRTTDFTTTNSNDSAPDFDTALYDPDGLWSAGAPERITIPASWDGKFIRLFMRGGWEDFTTGYCEMKLYRNIARGSIGGGNDDKLVGVTQLAPNAYNTFEELTTIPIQVFEGDFFVPVYKTIVDRQLLAYFGISIVFGAYMVEPGDGPQGDPGEGVPPGGTTGQALVKLSAADFDTDWDDVTAVAALDDLTDVTITSPALNQALRYDGSQWINTSAIWRPLMDGAGAVVVDGATGEAVMVLS